MPINRGKLSMIKDPREKVRFSIVQNKKRVKMLRKEQIRMKRAGDR